MQYFEEELDITIQKIKHLEDEIFKTHELLLQTMDSLKETQRFLVKVAYNQSEMAKRVSSWPYIAVSDNTRNEGE